MEWFWSAVTYGIHAENNVGTENVILLVNNVKKSEKLRKTVVEPSITRKGGKSSRLN